MDERGRNEVTLVARDSEARDKPSSGQIRAKLKDLKGMFDDGLINQEEFDAKRKQWLDQM